MDRISLTARVSNYFTKKKKVPNTWFAEIGKNMNQLQITDDHIEERALLRKKLNSSQKFQDKHKK